MPQAWRNLLGNQMRVRPTIRLLGIERSPFFPVSEICGRFGAARALRFHAAAGDQLAQHLAEQRSPLVLRRRAAFGVHYPILRFAAQFFGELLRAVGENIAEPSFAPGAAFEQEFPSASRLPHSSFRPSVLSVPSTPFSQASNAKPGAASEVAALDAEIIDALGEIKNVIAFEPEIIKSIHPLAAGVEVADSCL